MPAEPPTDISEHLSRTEAALAEALEERTRLWEELNRRRAVEHELEEVRRTVETMQASPSWRLTAPLRSAKRTWHRYATLAARASAKLRA
jgi:hypothetical protein